MEECDLKKYTVYITKEVTAPDLLEATLLALQPDEGELKNLSGYEC